MDAINLPKNVHIKAISYGAPKALDNGGKVIYMSYKGRPLIIQTPEMHVPFGLSRWSADAKGPEKLTLELSFKGMEERENLAAFYDMARALDRKLVADAMENSMSWLKKKITAPEVVEALFTPMVRNHKDKETGEVSDKYPPNFRVTIPQRDGGIACQVYNARRWGVDMAAFPNVARVEAEAAALPEVAAAHPDRVKPAE